MIRNMQILKPYLVYIITLLVAYYVSRVIYLLYFHPLARYPGPFLAKFSTLWKSYVSFSQKEHLIYYNLHQKYGPIVRDGPNSLSFNDHRAIKKIYGIGKNSFSRATSFPLVGLNPEHPPVFFSIDARTHQASRRKVGGAYSMSSILAMEDRIDTIIAQLLECLDEEADAGNLFDLSRWINFFTVDMVSELAYGAAFGCLRTRSDVSGIVAGLQGGAFINVILSLIPSIGKVLFSGPLGEIIKPPETSGIGLAMKMAGKIVDERRETPSDQCDLLNAILFSKDPQGVPIHFDQVRGEIIATLAAGSDTTGMTILGCIGNLLKNSSILVHLRQELDQAVGDGRIDPQSPTYAQLSKIPYLEAVVNETLRLSPSIGAAFYRSVPKDGAELIPGTVVPGGVHVGINNWVMGRNETLYGDDALVFRPERWLQDESTRKHLSNWEFSFGHGARVCIGKNLAHVEIYKTVYHLVRRYEIESVDLNKMWKEELKLFLMKSDMLVTLRRRDIS